MLQNFFTVAIRNFFRQRLYSLINVFGLAVGLICSLFVFLWIKDETEKDQYHKDLDRIYSIFANLDQKENGIVTWGTPGPLGDAIRDRVPEVEFTSRTDGSAHMLVFKEMLFMEGGWYVDPDFFKIFSFNLVQGSAPVQNLDKTWICISSDLAKKLFNETDPIGKQLKLERKYDVTVIGVFENTPPNSSLKFDFLVPYEIYREVRGNGFEWGNFDHPLFVKLQEGKIAQDVIAAINARTAPINPVKTVSFYMQPFADSYLNGNFENGKPVGGRVQYVKIFSLVGVFILVIACINFMNMATARASSRAKEVGVRKVAGAQRVSLVAQFLGESVFISLLSMCIALVAVAALLPAFNILVGKQISLGFTHPAMLVGLFASVVLTGLIAGSYPAFYLSSFRPAAVLKSATVTGQRFPLRKILVIFQFSLTVILIAGALVVFNQINFIRDTNIGYDRQSVLSFETTPNIYDNFESFRTEALQQTGVKMVSRANESLVRVNNQNGSVSWQGKLPQIDVLFRTVVVDYDFLETMGLQLTQGRFFSKNFNDTTNFVITQKAADIIGFTNPVGQRLTQWGRNGTIVGVVSDFHSRSLHESVDPIIFMCDPSWANTIVVKFEATQTAQTTAALEAVYHKFSPAYPFNYSFLDDDFERLYSTERVTGVLALGFTGMAIIISSLGLLGLAAYTTERKKKEISIRKTLGASAGSLVAKISREFLQLSLVAIVIGYPIAWYLMSRFLEGYAYHISIDWKIFVFTSIAIVLVSVLTVIYQVTRAALANPVDALRNE